MTPQETAELFQSVDPETRLELLLDYADRLPPLDPDYAPLRDAGLNMVHECQSPVFLMAETDAGTLRLHVDVPREAPTARGFTSVLVDLFDGKPVEVLASAPEDLVHELGLTQLLGMQRKRGLAGIYYRVRSALS